MALIIVQPLGQPSRVGQTAKRQNRHCDITYHVCEAVAQAGSKYKNGLPTPLAFTVEWEHDPNMVRAAFLLKYGI